MSETTVSGKNAFDFLRMNERQGKPRQRGVTEIRGPYYTPMGKRYLAGRAGDDGPVRRLAEVRRRVVHASYQTRRSRSSSRSATPTTCMVSTGGFIEYVLTQGPEAVRQLPRGVQGAGLRHRRGVQRLHHHPDRRPGAAGRGGAEGGAEGQAGGRDTVRGGRGQPPPAELAGGGDARPGVGDRAGAKRYLDAGASMVMIESEGITENVTAWRTDVPAEIVDASGWRR